MRKIPIDPARNWNLVVQPAVRHCSSSYCSNLTLWSHCNFHINDNSKNTNGIQGGFVLVQKPSTFLGHIIKFHNRLCHNGVDFLKVVSTMIRLCAGWLGFDSWQAQGWDFFLLTNMSRLDLGPTQTPSWWVLGALSPAVKQLGMKQATHLHLVPRSRMHGAIPPLPIRQHGIVLI